MKGGWAPGRRGVTGARGMDRRCAAGQREPDRIEGAAGQAQDGPQRTAQDRVIQPNEDKTQDPGRKSEM